MKNARPEWIPVAGEIISVVNPKGFEDMAHLRVSSWNFKRQLYRLARQVPLALHRRRVCFLRCIANCGSSILTLRVAR